MKILRKSHLSAALGAAIASMSATTVSAFSVDVDHRDVIRYEDSGDALLFPFYTAIEKEIHAGEISYTNTAFSLTNTSDTDSVAVKIRFRDQKYSLDVWDTIVFLSPNDKFDFIVKSDPRPGAAKDGIPWVHIDENEDSCTMVPGRATNTDFPSKFRKPSLMSAAEWSPGLLATVGHAEVIGMANLTYADWILPGTNNDISLHSATILKDQQVAFGYTGCQALFAAFANQVGVSGIEGADEAPDTLVGRFLINGGNGTGVEAADKPIVLRNTLGDDTGGPNSRAYISAQSAERCDSDRYFYDNCESVYAWDATEQDHPHLGDIAWLDVYNIDDALEARTIEGDWSNNPANFVGTDWIVSFPTKYVYRDWLNCNGAPGNEWCDVTPPNWEEGPEEQDGWGRYSWWSGQLTTGVGDTGDYEAVPAKCLEAQIQAYGIDEEASFPETSPTDFASFCNEVNVFTMGSYDAATETEANVRPSLIQLDAYRQIISFENLDDSVRGWASLSLFWPEADPDILNWDDEFGAATSGLVFIVRNTVDPAENNASMAALSAQANKAGDDEEYNP